MNNAGSTRALTLSTLAFAISFALWGMISPMSKTFQADFGLTTQQGWWLLAVPVLLGSIGRIPIGMLADRFGGRIVFTVLMLFTALPAFMLSVSGSYTDLLFWGLLLGLAGTSFAVGAPFTSRWFPPERQGLALGIYGVGNIGQSLTLIGIPFLTASIGWRPAFRLFALAIFAYGILFGLLARNAPVEVRPRGFGEMLGVLATKRLSWLFSLFYFVTFGGFVALSIGLPRLLQEIFGLTLTDASARVAGFVVLATALRPVGGWISDRIGGSRTLVAVFIGAALFAPLMAIERMIPFTLGALGVGAFAGLGNGAVFKLVPQHFPRDAGAVTGLVGAMGGLGGFFPPIVLGLLRANTGSYGPGFYLLSLFCLVCLALNAAVLLRISPRDPAVASAS